MMYVAMEIGCIECGEDSFCLGIFTTKEAAFDQGETGSRFAVFAVDEPDTPINQAQEIDTP